MKHLLLNLSTLFLIAITTSSCSNDDDNQPCYATDVTMTINGEFQSFQAYGRGIDIREGGYELQLNFYRGSNNPFSEQNLTVKLPYKARGENIFEGFLYSQYTNDTPFEGDFLDGELQSQVITNTSTCFYATFSGTLSDGNQEIVITDGELKYEYEDSFDE
jgi:hypothetical protein